MMISHGHVSLLQVAFVLEGQRPKTWGEDRVRQAQAPQGRRSFAKVLRTKGVIGVQYSADSLAMPITDPRYMVQFNCFCCAGHY